MSEHYFDTPIGHCGLQWHDTLLTGFRLPEASQPDPAPTEELPDWVQIMIQRVQAHLRGDFQDFADAPYDFSLAGDFARQVYQTTLTVKAGGTCSYGDIARMMGQTPGVARAIGVALGANPWPLLVPCHRIVAADGHMTGFSGPGGIRTKLRLLALEGAQLFAE